MAKCKEHGEYTAETSCCGIAVGVGSSFGEHMLSCPRSMGVGGFFGPRRGDRYFPWEAPGGCCPACWHADHPGRSMFDKVADDTEPSRGEAS